MLEVWQVVVITILGIILIIGTLHLPFAEFMNRDVRSFIKKDDA